MDFLVPDFWGELLHSIWYSLAVILVAYLISAILSISIGIFCFLYPRFGRRIMFLADLVRPVSAIAMFPAIVSVLGIGVESRVFVIFWTAWPPVLIVTVHALQAVSSEVVDAASLDAEKWRILYYVQMPIAIREITAGLRVSVSAAWIGLTAAEMLGASDGLGFQILKYAQSFNYPMMYFYIVVVAIIGVIMSRTVNFFYDRMENYSEGVT